MHRQAGYCSLFCADGYAPNCERIVCAILDTDPVGRAPNSGYRVIPGVVYPQTGDLRSAYIEQIRRHHFLNQHITPPAGHILSGQQTYARFSPDPVNHSFHQKNFRCRCSRQHVKHWSPSDCHPASAGRVHLFHGSEVHVVKVRQAYESGMAHWY